MADWTIYHNPKCSNSRGALSLLEAAGVKPRLVEYLKQPLTVAELRVLITQLGGEWVGLVRTKEEKYSALKFDVSNPSVVAEQLARFPELLQRPVVVKGTRAIIARPPERVRELLG